MLKGIPKIISPEILKILCEMGHGDDKADTSAWDDYTKILKKESPESEPVFCERFAYYERAKNAYAVIITGEERQYANIILKKGCVLPGM